MKPAIAPEEVYPELAVYHDPITTIEPLPIVISEPVMPAIEVVNLTVRYGQVPGCEAIHFSALPGERIAVIGPNGAGKSTLFKAMVGLLPMYSGSISVGGESCAASHFRVSYVPQHESVDWKFPANVWDVVMMSRTRHIGYFRTPRKVDHQAVRDALEKVEMWHLRHRQIGQLSGGQRRRVFIARALAQKAAVLLMDEPFAGVDASAEAEIMDVLDTLRELEVTIIVSTHNLGQAAYHYDKVLMMNRQQIAFGPTAEVFNAKNLSRTFGGFLTVWQDQSPYTVIADDSCHEC
ncbi:MAG: metal ABC transporter ATP-binding protein [Chloroflexi bacterium]|nr:metal ABC transporter ATP-binding protein [Chloroflexota bacterium]